MTTFSIVKKDGETAIVLRRRDYNVKSREPLSQSWALEGDAGTRFTLDLTELDEIDVSLMGRLLEMRETLKPQTDDPIRIKAGALIKPALREANFNRFFDLD